MTSAIVPTPPDNALAETLADVAGQLAPSSAQTYTYDAQHFASWLAGEGLDITTLDRAAIIRYRKHLAETYAKRPDMSEATAGGKVVNRCSKNFSGVEQNNVL